MNNKNKEKISRYTTLICLLLFLLIMFVVCHKSQNETQKIQISNTIVITDIPIPLANIKNENSNDNCISNTVLISKNTNTITFGHTEMTTTPPKIDDEVIQPDPSHKTEEPIEEPIKEENFSDKVFGWFKSQLNDTESIVSKYFATRNFGSSLDSTGCNYAPEINNELSLYLEVDDVQTIASWKILKNKEKDNYDIFWANEDIRGKKDKEELSEDVVKYNTKTDKKTEGNAEVKTKNMKDKDSKNVTYNVIDDKSFDEKEHENNIEEIKVEVSEENIE